jgi:hypothetical protein
MAGWVIPGLPAAAKCTATPVAGVKTLLAAGVAHEPGHVRAFRLGVAGGLAGHWGLGIVKRSRLEITHNRKGRKMTTKEQVERILNSTYDSDTQFIAGDTVLTLSKWLIGLNSYRRNTIFTPKK